MQYIVLGIVFVITVDIVAFQMYSVGYEKGYNARRAEREDESNG